MQFSNYLLRPLEADDAPDLFTLIDSNRKRLEDFFAGTVNRNKTLDETLQFVPEVIARANNRTYYPFVIVDTTTDKIIGYTDIKSIDWNIPKAEIGYFIDKDYEGKGISTKAAENIVGYCFEILQLHKVFLRTHESNIASRRIAEKLGFIVEGNIRSDYKMTNGVIIDVMYYGLLKNDWHERPKYST